MNWEEAILFCESHECKDCPVYKTKDCRSDYEKQVLHYPCCINLVGENGGINYETM